ncbi:olfactory receptor 14A16-like [Callospermophilus lateralis]
MRPPSSSLHQFHNTASMANHTVEMEFYLTLFSEDQEPQLAHGFLFLLIYLVALVGNLLIIVLVTVDHCLHTSMYFFLKNLSLLDACLVSVTVPNFIVSSFCHKSTISFPGCVSQVLLVTQFAGTELSILTAMSYDRYVAICHPLHYDVIMNRGLCVQMVAVSWFLGGIFGVLYSAGTFSLSFCGSRKLPQFFCDIPQLLAVSSSKHVTAEIVFIIINVFLDTGCFAGIIVSYVFIFSTFRRIPSTAGWAKAYSTCLPHLAVVVLFLSTGFCAYLKPLLGFSSSTDLSLSVGYVVLPPSLNPVIYSLRNKAMKAELEKLVTGKLLTKQHVLLFLQE